ncbi:MAG: tetratricopeptide repeat protein [Oxalicibacterium faecigallinarum]|uniref:L,D-transpeptidase Cds6 family protein n=1 Tax=Oxalicibacterium faecigallinarum TaxID=573741 RepID=UPI00280837CB|nr:tetratricopeptide repeat protein [Oxalicibacterium faecigallinarum]MDQ7969875.1 tetratricopeptide repeat protein [Oxalicibacterium faecigallinarum]
MPTTSRIPSRFALIKGLQRSALIAGLVAMMHVTPAMADDIADVSQLVRSGQYTAALNKADAFLKQKPRDPQMRFLKGVILTEQNKSAEAIDVFTKLSKDFPALPEPYNNLAVLYAAAGEYEKARTALDQAIRTNPTYATAYENLGDVHAKLASQAYDKALQLDQNNNAAKSKLTMVRTLVGNTTGGTNPQVAAVTPAVPVRPAAQPAQQTPQPTPQPVPPTAPAVSAPPAAPVTEPPKADPAMEQRRAEEERQRAERAKANEAAQAANAKVLDAVESWAKAWSARDVGGYLNAYSKDFALPSGQSRKTWETERRARIEDKNRINVQILSPQVSISGKTATVRFRQVYDSDRFKSDSRKTLVLTQQGNAWRIQQERTGN